MVVYFLIVIEVVSFLYTRSSVMQILQNETERAQVRKPRSRELSETYKIVSLYARRPVVTLAFDNNSH